VRQLISFQCIVKLAKKQEAVICLISHGPAIVYSDSTTGCSINELLHSLKQSHSLGSNPNCLRTKNSSIRPDPDDHAVTFEDAAVGIHFSPQNCVNSVDLSINQEHAAADQEADAHSLGCIFNIFFNMRQIGLSGLKVVDASDLFLEFVYIVNISGLLLGTTLMATFHLVSCRFTLSKFWPCFLTILASDQSL
jgi:hypothetical protein